MATPKDLPRDIGGFIRDLRQSARISLRQLAEQTGVSNPYLSQIERGLRKPSAEVLQQLASALRVSTPAMYLRAGLLDGDSQQGVLAAIAVDPELTIAQKQSLSQIYETFRGENTRNAQPADEASEPDPTGVRTEPADGAAEPADGAAESVDRTAEPVDGAAESVDRAAESLDGAAESLDRAAESLDRAAEPARVPGDEAARQAAAVVDSVAAVDTGATPAPKTTGKPAKKAARRATTTAAPTAQEEKS